MCGFVRRILLSVQRWWCDRASSTRSTYLDQRRIAPCRIVAIGWVKQKREVRIIPIAHFVSKCRWLGSVTRLFCLPRPNVGIRSSTEVDDGALPFPARLFLNTIEKLKDRRQHRLLDKTTRNERHRQVSTRCGAHCNRKTRSY